MNGFLKWALILGGVGYLFRHEIETAIGLSTASSSAPAPTPTPTPAPQIIVASDPTTPARMLTAAKAAGAIKADGDRLNAYQWAYFYQQVRGVAPPPSASLGISDPNTLFSINEWWTLAAAAGLSGLRATASSPRRTRAAAAWGF